jgi:UDP-N-acetylglucosamine 2-epimerase (non-hydrolysing)
MIRPLLIFGTRPEAIKMAPVVLACRQIGELDPIVCLTGQHRQMLDQVNGYFGIEAHEDLHVMSADQSLCGLTLKCLEGIDGVLQRYQPDCDDVCHGGVLPPYPVYPC